MRLHEKLAVLLVGACLAASGAAWPVPAAAAIRIGDDTTYANLDFLLQSRLDVTQKAAPDGKAPDTDLYVRRVRFMLYGQLNDIVSFFAETDSPSFGKRGDLGVMPFMQDAYVELNFDRALQVDTGMLLVPFSHHGMQSAASLLTMDYHLTLLRYPTGSSKVLRDFGIMLRGLLLGDRVEYRAAVFNGVHGNTTLAAKENAATGMSFREPVDPRNDADAPRLSGRLTFNFFEPEGGPGVSGYFWDGIYLKETDHGIVSPKKVVAVGASVDYQQGLNVTLGPLPAVEGETRTVVARRDYVAWDVDVFVDLPVTADALVGVTGQLGFYDYDYGTFDSDRFFSGGIPEYSGQGVIAEAGLRRDRYQIVAAADWFDADAPDHRGDILAYSGGFNYWWHALATNIKLELGRTRATSADLAYVWRSYGLVQLQFLL